MAQIMLTFIDSVNGSVNSLVKLKDKDVSRMYEAFKFRHAEHILSNKQSSGEVLEATDTLENIANNIPVQDVLDNLFLTFMDRVISDTHNIESKKILKDFYNKLGFIEMEQ